MKMHNNAVLIILDPLVRDLEYLYEYLSGAYESSENDNFSQVLLKGLDRIHNIKCGVILGGQFRERDINEHSAGSD